MRRSCWHDWRPGLGALLTLLALGGIAPQARAGCEQPTVVMWPNDAASNRADVHLMSSVEPHSLPHHSAPGPQPCKGPNCSRAPLTPVAPPATTITPPQEWACLSVVPGGRHSNGAAHCGEAGSLTPIFRASSIYHPPR
jgi:hypothetical protein